MKILEVIKSYLSDKWNKTKPILVKYVKDLKDILFDYINKVWTSIKINTQRFLIRIKNKTIIMFGEIKEKVLTAEMKIFEKILYWLEGKLDVLYERLFPEDEIDL